MYRKNNMGSIIGAIFAILIVVGSFWGYVWNIVKLAGIVDDPITGMFVLRAIGIFIFPLGIILGYF